MPPRRPASRPPLETCSRSIAALALAAAAALAGPARAAERYLAVLELTGAGDSFVREALTDRARAAASEALRGSYYVITRENVISLLARNERTCDALEGECSVDLGRAVGADLVLSGRLRPVEDRLEVGLQLHDTVTGALVSSGSTSVATPLEALDRMESLSRSVLGKFVTPQRDRFEPHLSLEARSGFTAGSGSDFAFGVLVGRELTRRWGIELGYTYVKMGDWVESNSSGLDLLKPGGSGWVGHLLSFGGVIAPFDTPHLTFAAHGGAIRTVRAFASTTAPVQKFEGPATWAPALLAEFRLTAVTRIAGFGLRPSLLVYRASDTVTAPSGARLAGPGLRAELIFFLGVRL